MRLSLGRTPAVAAARRPVPYWCAAILLMAWSSACSAAPRWTLVDPGQPSAEQRARLVEAERHYRAGEPFDSLRSAIVADPVTAWWFTRMVVRDVVVARDGKITATESRNAHVRDLPEFLASGQRVDAADSDPLLRAAIGHRDPLEARAIAEFDRLGLAAVPCLLRDLARHPQSYVRQIGVDLLGRVGPTALPMIDQELLANADPVQRRTGAQAIAAMPMAPAIAARLQTLASDPHYTVRAAAYDGLAGADADVAPLLQRALGDDPEPFARRTAARALGSHREAASAQALVAYLHRCQTERDAEGAEAAQAALQKLARTRGPRSVEAWRAWAGAFAPTGG